MSPYHKAYPWVDPLTGLDGEELAANYREATGQQETIFLGCHGKIGWAIDVLKRAKDPADRKSIVEAIKGTKTDLTIGHIDFTEPVDPNGDGHVHANVYKSACCQTQVVKSADPKYKYDLALVTAFNAPGAKTVPAIPFVYPS